MNAWRVIVAEDDPAMQSWLATILVKMGASVRLAASGWELLSVLADEDADLVISDVRMPLPHGLEVLAMARAAGVTTPFVLITSFANDRVRDQARALDARVLDKPFLIGHLEDQIRELVGPR